MLCFYRIRATPHCPWVDHHVAVIRGELMLPLLFHPSSSACSSSCFSLQMKEFRREEVVLCRLNMVGSKGPKPILIEFILFVNTLS